MQIVHQSLKEVSYIKDKLSEEVSKFKKEFECHQETMKDADLMYFELGLDRDYYEAKSNYLKIDKRYSPVIDFCSLYISGDLISSQEKFESLNQEQQAKIPDLALELLGIKLNNKKFETLTDVYDISSRIKDVSNIIISHQNNDPEVTKMEAEFYSKNSVDNREALLKECLVKLSSQQDEESQQIVKKIKNTFKI